MFCYNVTSSGTCIDFSLIYLFPKGRSDYTDLASEPVKARFAIRSLPEYYSGTLTGFRKIVLNFLVLWKKDKKSLPNTHLIKVQLVCNLGIPPQCIFIVTYAKRDLSSIKKSHCLFLHIFPILTFSSMYCGVSLWSI